MLKNHKKLIIIIFGVAIIIILGILLLRKNKNSDFSYLVFDQNRPIKIYEDGKYGYINTSGKVIIEPKYTTANDFYGNYAKVYEVVNTEDGEKEICEIIDKKGNVKAISETSYCNITYNQEYHIYIINDQLYDGNLKKLSSDDKIVNYKDYGYLTWISETKKTVGIMNSTGKVIYTFKYNNDYPGFNLTVKSVNDTLNEKYCVVYVDDMYAIINCDTGKIIVDFSSDYISNKGDNIFEQNDIQIFINNNKIVYSGESDDIELSYNSDGYLTIKDSSKSYYDDDRYKYYDIKNKTVLDEEPEVETITNLEELTGYKKFSCNNGYGLMKDDKVTLSCEWDSIYLFSDTLYKYLESKGRKYILTNKDSKTFLFDLKNNEIVYEMNSSSIYKYRDSTFIYYKDTDTKNYVVYNLLTNKSILIDKDDSFNIYTNYIIVENNKELKYYNTNLKLIYTMNFN